VIAAFGLQGVRVSTDGGQARLVEVSKEAWQGAFDDREARSFAGSSFQVDYASGAAGGLMSLRLAGDGVATWSYPRYVRGPAYWRQRWRLVMVAFPDPEEGFFVGAVSRDGRKLQGCEANAKAFPTVWTGETK
jgi:hypothetical protein